MANDHVIHTAAYRGALRRIAAELGCDPDEATVLARRNALDPQTHARNLLRRTSTGMMLVDTGFGSADAFSINDQQDALQVAQREVVRLETLAERLVAQAGDAREWLQLTRHALRQAGQRGAVGVKTICAYRASLRLTRPSADELAEAFEHLKQMVAGGHPVRLTGNALCHPLLFEAARECLQLNLPIQVHCGFGDPDEDLAEASPLGLRPLFVDEEFRGLNVILLHCYPYHREAAYLCSVFPGVYMDLSLAIPFASIDGARALAESLGLCPTSKLLYASDASRYPEVFFVAAVQYREALANALAELIDRNVLTARDAIVAGTNVLGLNARRVYHLT
jgi:uncharacterized protein